MAHEQNGLFPDTDPARIGNGRRQRRLFLPKLLQAAADDQRLAGEARDQAYAILSKWAELEASGRLLKKKETSLEGEFIPEVFGKALGYTLFSDNLESWQLEQKFALPGGQQADAVIGFFSSREQKAPRAIIELKGPRVDLDRDRSRRRTPVQQCFDYLYSIPSCPWGIVCNYVSFRLYHRNRTPYVYESFTLESLRDPQRFREFYAVFSAGGLLPRLLGQKARADQLLEESETQQRMVGVRLYDDYSRHRLVLLDLLRKPPYGRSLDEAIRIVQKLLDRIIFIAFCEDRGLLPDKAIERAWRNIAEYTHAANPRWDNFRNLFRSIDKGNTRSGISAYNGGLFDLDDDLDGLELDDEFTHFFKEIGSYDFKDEVNVDVLGHLFEQSITELEVLRADPAVLDAPEALGRRKREGIYYTPRHVTEYLVDQTIGAVLRVQFAALAEAQGIDADADVTDGTREARVRYDRARLDAMRRLRVCDPACGSGAFLIEAYDRLEETYDEIITSLCTHDGEKHEALYADISRTILRENLYGVDLSAEAVEITQLALWLRTAKRGQTLANLSDNIKIGNSLADDATVDPRAFNWEQGFPGVFAEGGFDCVIGNPPYVKLQNFRKREPRIAEFLVQRYRSARTGNFDMYLPFIERGLELLKPAGRLGFIAPNVWLFNEYGRGLRELVAEQRSLRHFVDFKSHQVFEDATTYTALQIFAKQPSETIETADARHGDLKKLQFHAVPYTRLSADPWALLGDDDQAILDRMRQRSVTLKEASGGIIVGIQTSADIVYHVIRIKPGLYYSKALNDEVELEEEMVKPLISGEDAVPFATPPTDKYLLFPYLVADDECRLYTEREMKKFKRTWNYLKKNEKCLRGRETGKMDHDGWYGYVYPKNLDKQELPKIGVPETVNRLQAFIDPKGERYFNNVRVNGILARADKAYSLEYLLALMNSQALDFYFKRIAKPKDRDYFEANKQFIAPLPIPKTKDQKPLAKIAMELADLHAKRIKTAAAVHRRFQVDLPPTTLVAASPLPPRLTGRLQSFDETPREALFKDMEKLAERKLKPAERTRWDEYLTKQADAAVRIKREITDRTAEMNDRVFALYGLTGEHVKRITESSLGAASQLPNDPDAAPSIA